MAVYLVTPLTDTGQTGNNTHTSRVTPPIAAQDALVLVIEAVGATPTVTWKFQGSFDPVTTTDANSVWVDVPYITAASDTLAVATQVATAVGSYGVWVAQSQIRYFRKYRLVTSANTNVTYRGELHGLTTY